MKQILVGLLAVMMLAFLVSTPAGATSTTKSTWTTTTAGTSTPGQVTLYTSQIATWAASADTFIFPFPQLKPVSESGDFATLGTMVVETQSANGDSHSVCVRYEVSNDGTNWHSITVGTDSTTWTTTKISTDAQPWKVTPINLAVATYFGKFPYMRIYVFGKTTYNLAGGKMRIRFKQ